MLEGPNTATSDASALSAAVREAIPQTLQGLRDLLGRLQGELKFKQTRIEALNFEIARHKHWRFGSSSESLAPPRPISEGTRVGVKTHTPQPQKKEMKPLLSAADKR